jgi:putative peptide zinc metalloprotease protein
VALVAMTGTLFSSSWYRVAEFKPRLRPHTATHRHMFRGRLWYVLQDRQSGQFHRLSPVANLMLCLMDGRRTMQDIWDAVGRRHAEDPPTQDETIQLLSQLHTADLLQGDLPPDFLEMADRAERAGQRRILQTLRNPLALRLPLFDPDRFLAATLAPARLLFSAFGFVAWLALVTAGFVAAITHWPELQADLADRVLIADNVAVIVLVYPLIKSLHELGHAYATKVWGGEVHEIGVMLLVFIPIIYVDASGSAAFREKRRRIVVGAAGILVETALAAIAMFVWLRATPGLGRSIAFDVMLIGGVSTLLFNGNPLLRFDGYYIFSDLIEIPNLGARANRYLFYLLQRYLLGVDDVDSPATTPGEARWMTFYALASFAYRMLVSLGIALFLAVKFVAVGALLAIWSMSAIVLAPLYRGVKFLATSPRLQRKRRRAFGVVGGLAALALAALFVYPAPYNVIADGVVVFPDRAELRAKTAGFVRAVDAKPGDEVGARQTLVELEDPSLATQITVLEAQLAETRDRLTAVEAIDRVQAGMFADQAAHLQSRLDTFRQRQRDLAVSADHAGRWLIARTDDLPGRYAKRGDLIGYVVAADDPVIQALAPQADIDLIRDPSTRVEVRLVDDMDHTIPAHIRRVTPAAQQDVPSLALTTRGGGEIALDPTRGQRPSALFSYFLVEVELSEPRRARYLGERGYVRFSFGEQPIAWRWLRSARQFFLGQFRV